MTRLKFNLQSMILYILVFFAIFIPYYIACPSLMLFFAPIAFVLGFFASAINTIIIELRRLNGFKFEPYNDIKKEKEELIKS